MITKREYGKMVEKNSPKSSTAINCLTAFLTGGAVCLFGQALLELYSALGMEEDDAKTLVSCSLILLGVMLTALGVYDKIAKRAGAGTLVPITGFANAMSSSAIEFKCEGFIAGVGAKMFSIAGPVIVYGVFAATIYGAVLWVLHLFGITMF